MKQVGALAVFLLAFAGCSTPVQTPPPSSSSSSPFPVEPGTAILFEPIPTKDGFSLSVSGGAYYGQPGPRTQDSFACSATVVAQGWKPSDRRFTLGSPFVGLRNGTRATWAGVVIPDAHWSNGASGGVGGHDPGILFLVGHDQVGPTVISNITVKPEEGTTIRQLATGRYWCLDGPSQFQAGDYLVTDMMLQAKGLTWSQEFKSGVLARVESTAMVQGLTFDGPGGMREASGGDRLDLTFCSPTPGNWRLNIGSAVSQGPWNLKVQVFDMVLPGFPCTGSWITTPKF